MGYWRAAVFAALLPCSAVAQDVTLTSRDGALSVAGTLQGYDGEFFRIDSAYGPLTLDASGVICDGPACPDLTAPKAVIRLVGEADAGAALLPPLIVAFAQARGLVYSAPATADAPAILTDPATNKVLAEISFQPLPPDQARAAIKAGRAELMVASAVEPDLGSKAMALDALVPIVAPDNPLPGVSTIDLAAVLAGDVKNWSEVGGPDMPLVLHGLAADSDLQRALSDRLGRDPAASVTHPDLRSMAEAVARDPWAIALTGRASVGRGAGAAVVGQLRLSLAAQWLGGQGRGLSADIAGVRADAAPPLAADGARVSGFSGTSGGTGGDCAGRLYRPRCGKPADDGGRLAADQRHSGRGRGDDLGRSETAYRADGGRGPAVADLPV